MRSSISYTLGRVCAVGTKSLLLFVANNYLTAATAQGLAVTFLASALALVGAAAGPHRRFYVRYFSEHARFNGVSFYVYAASVTILTVFGCAIVCGIVLHFTRAGVLAAAACLFFTSEKVADEVLRLRLFERNFSGWGRLSLARSVAQLLPASLLITAEGTALESRTLIVVMTAANLLVFVPQLPRHLLRNLWAHGIAPAAWVLKGAVRSLARNWVLWVVALLGSAVAYIDRMIALALDQAVLPVFMLVVMCFSIVQMSVDFYFVSQYRRDFLEQRIHMPEVFSNGIFVRSLGGGLVLALVGCGIVLHVARNGSSFPLGYAAAICVVQVATSISAIASEILYWTRKLAGILYIESLFWLMFAAAALIARAFATSPTTFLALAATCAVIRLASYIFAAARVVPTRPKAASATV